jgi:hypothetical protein
VSKTDKAVYKLDGTIWVKKSDSSLGNVLSISVGTMSVYAVKEDFTISEYSFKTNQWTTVTGNASAISVSFGRNVFTLS